jgi:hypothetical protein
VGSKPDSALALPVNSCIVCCSACFAFCPLGLEWLLNESNLPALFGVHTVSAYVHVWNSIPTLPLPGTLPNTAWFNKKLDISHFRVFGCTAYTYIQRDQHKSLQSHMEKCLFFGYPSGYKGWQFYNLVTRKFIISERAIFNERSFPGLKRMSSVDLMPVGTPVTFPDILDSRGDDNFVPEPEIAPIEPDALPQPLLAVRVACFSLS